MILYWTFVTNLCHRRIETYGIDIFNEVWYIHDSLIILFQYDMYLRVRYMGNEYIRICYVDRAKRKCRMLYEMHDIPQGKQK
jgi:hypothetical protein